MRTSQINPHPQASALEESTDEALWQRACGGDETAFARLYERYRPRSLAIARRMAGRDAEDAVQQAFMSIWVSRESFDPRRGTLAAWMMTVVRNRAADVGRGHVRRKPETVVDTVPELPDQRRLDEVAEQRASAREVRAAVAALPRRQREVVALSYYGELSQSEIARSLSLPLGTVKGRSRAAMRALRPALLAEAA